MKKFYSNISGFLICILLVIMLPLCIYMGLNIEHLAFKVILGILMFVCVSTCLVILFGNIPGGFINKRKREQEDKIKQLEKEVKELKKGKEKEI